MRRATLRRILSVVAVALLAAPALAQQYSRPTTDVANSGWTLNGAATVAGCLNETIPDDGTTTVFVNNSAGSFEVNMAPVTAPGTTASHFVRVRTYCDKAGATLNVTLKQGSTTIQAWTGQALNLRTWETHTLTVTSAAAITNYGALSVQVATNIVPNKAQLDVTWVELEVPSVVTVPTVAGPAAATSITTTTAVLGANVTSGAPLAARGTIWNTTGVGLTLPHLNALAEGGVGPGAYSHVRTGFAPATQYWYVGYATNAAGTGYTPGTATFFTEASPATNLTFSAIAENDLTIGWTTVPATTPDVIVVVKQNIAVDSAPVDGVVYTPSATFGAGTQLGTGNYVVYVGPLTSVKVSGLTAGTTYHAAVYGASGVGATPTTLLNYNVTTPLTGSQQTATAAVPPTLSSPTFSNVDVASADLGATIDADGGATITDHGTVWDVTSNPAANSSGDGVGTTGAFSYNVLGLPTATRVYFRGYATNSAGTAFSPEASFYTEPNEATNATITNVTTSGMRISWTAVDGAGAVVLVKAVSAVDAPPVDGTEYTASTTFGSGTQIGTGNFVVHVGAGTQVDVTGLAAGTDYHVAVYQYAGAGAGASGINYQQDSPATATAQTPAGAPTVSTPTVTSVDTTSATLGATVDSDGGGTLIERGTLWNTTGAPITENSAGEGGTSTGAFSHSRTGLPSATQVFFRGFATNASATGYSADASFYTEPTAATAVAFSLDTSTSLRISWTSGNGGGAVVLVKAGSAVDASPSDGTVYNGSGSFGLGDEIGTGNFVVHAGAGSQVDVAGLAPNTTYHVAVFEYAGSGTGISGTNYQQDTPGTGSRTTPAGAPTVSSPTFAAVTDTTATLGGTVDSDGGASLTARGTVWSTAPAPTLASNPLAEGGTATGTFTHSRTTLPSGTRIYFRAYASNASADGLSTDGSFYTEPTAASGVTFSSVGQTSMQVDWTAGGGDGAVVVVKQGSAVDSGPVDGTVYAANAAFGSGPQLGTGNYVVFAGAGTSVTVTGLSSATTYHVAVYAYAGTTAGASGINYQQDGPATGSQQSQAGAPSLSTPTVSGVDDGTATLGATITGDGGGAITERGTVWGTTTAPTGNALAEGGTATGSFSHVRTGLPQGTRIWYRGYAVNSGGTGYSPDGTFFTEPTAASGVSFSSVTATGLTISWTAGGGDGSIVVVKSGSAVDAVPVDGVEHAASAAFGAGADLGSGNYVVHRGTGSSVAVTGLAGSTTYYVAVFSYAGTGTGVTGVNYQQDAPATRSQLTNSPLSVPTLSSPTVASVTTTTATLGATIDSDGGDTISARGTVWNTTGTPVVENSLAEGGTSIGTFSHSRSSLPSGTKVYLRGYATNSGGNGYSPESFFFTEPTQASSVSFTSVRAISATVSWTAGGGDGVIVVMKQGAAVDASPVDGVEHAASSGFGGGAELGTANYVVYRGPANSVNVVGLMPETTYHVAVFEYAGTGAGTSGINYQQDAPATGSQATTVATTHNAMHNIDCVTCHSVWGTYTPRGTDQESACTQCHSETGAASAKANVGLHVVNGGSTIVDCGECHEVHNTSSYSFVTTDTHTGGSTAPNIKFIRWDMTVHDDNPQALEPTVFQQRPAHFAFTTTPYNGICETCHTKTANWTNDGLINGNSGTPADMTHEAGSDCTSCHVHSGGFMGGGDNCLSSSCHGTPPGAPNTAPDIESEFALTSHHVMGGTVTNEDCTVCHEEANDAAVHADGNVDLIDPDNASTIYSLARPVTRNRSTNVLETDIVTLQNNFCMGCHDSDGATATYLAGSSARRPFSSSDRDAPDVKSQFDPNISTFHHAVTAPGDSVFASPTVGAQPSGNNNQVTMVTPWNQTTGAHDKITCFDCHDLSGHGVDRQRMLRDPIDFDTMLATTSSNNLPAGMGATIETFCTRCHDASVYVSASDPEAGGSVFEYHGAGQQQHSAAGGNELGCMGCHAGIVNFGAIDTDNGALTGNVHGNAYTWGSGSWASGTATDNFMLGGWLGGWWINGSNGECSGGDCNHTGSSRRNGQSYSR